MINLTLPFSILPAARHRHRTIKAGDKLLCMSYNPQSKCDERVDTQLLAKAYMQKNRIKPICSACSASFLVGLSIPRSWSKKKQQEARDLVLKPDASKKKDWDNLSKFVCDCLNGICFDDDGRIVDGRLTKIYAEEPFTKMLIDETDHEEFTKYVRWMLDY